MGFFKCTFRRCPALYARDDRGATAVEYGIMAGFVAVVVIVGVTAFGASVRGLFELIASSPPL